MADFNALLRHLEKELTFQEKFLSLLSKERAAIVKLQKDEIDRFNLEKATLMDRGKELQNKRNNLIEKFANEFDDLEEIKLPTLFEKCETRDLKSKLNNVREELIGTTTSVREMQEHNAQLIKQSLGLVASTIAIFRSAPGTELPTYGEDGNLNSESDDPAFNLRARSFTREA